jgi:hypothetical protein
MLPHHLTLAFGGPTTSVRLNQIRISKPEIRNKFKIRMLQCSKQKPSGSLGFDHLNLDHWAFFRISCFGFRIFNPPQIAEKSQSEILKRYYPFPRYALMTSGFALISAGVPSAILRPKSRTMILSAISMTTPISCSTKMIHLIPSLRTGVSG